MAGRTKNKEEILPTPGTSWKKRGNAPAGGPKVGRWGEKRRHCSCRRVFARTRTKSRRGCTHFTPENSNEKREGGIPKWSVGGKGGFSPKQVVGGGGGGGGWGWGGGGVLVLGGGGGVGGRNLFCWGEDREERGYVSHLVASVPPIRERAWKRWPVNLTKERE